MTHEEWVRAEWARIVEFDRQGDHERAHALEDELAWWVIRRCAHGAEGATEAASALNRLRSERGDVERWFA